MLFALAMEINSRRSSNISGEKIASDEDLSTKILLRLPIQSILRSKCVSKLWLSLIINPRFPLLRNSIANRQPHPNSPSGLFLDIRTEYVFIPFNLENPVKPPFKKLSFDKEASASGTFILHSFNGLMLCQTTFISFPKQIVYNHKYYVYNPTVNQFTTLPEFDGRISTRSIGMSLVFDPLISTHFRVVCVGGRDEEEDGDYYQIQIYVYSSATGKWRVSCKPFHHELNELETEFTGGVYWNDSLYWLNDDASVTYFKLDEECIHHAPAPSNIARIHNILFESQDSLLLIERFVGLSQFDVLEMKRDYSEWLLKYKIDLVNVGQVFPGMHHRGYYTFEVLCVVLGEKEEDAFVVVEIPGKEAIRYNLKLKTFYKLCDFGDGYSMFNRQPDAFLFTEPLSVVSP